MGGCLSHTDRGACPTALDRRQRDNGLASVADDSPQSRVYSSSMTQEPYAFSIGNTRVVVEDWQHSPDSTTFRFTLQGRTLVCTVQDNHISIGCPHENWLPAGTLLTTLLEMFRAERAAKLHPLFQPRDSQ